MKICLSIVAIIFWVNSNAQDFTAAAQAFENDEFDKTLTILQQLETTVSANPKIESLRALTYDQSGSPLKAYTSVKRFFILAGRNGSAPGTKEMENLEQSLKTFFENDLKQRQENLKEKRSDNAENIVNQKLSQQTNLKTARQTQFDSYYDAKLKNAKADFTAAEIKLIKENIKTKTAETLNENTLKIVTLKFSDVLYIGQDENIVIDRLYNATIQLVQTDDAVRSYIKKQKKKTLKTDKDYQAYFAGLKDDFKKFLQLDYDGKQTEAIRIDDKYGIYLYDVALPCNLFDVAPFVLNTDGLVKSYFIQAKDGKVSGIGGMVTLSDVTKDFEKNVGLNLKDVGSIKAVLEKTYGYVDLKITKTARERNFAKYDDYLYAYNVKTNTFKYKIQYFFGPYGYANGNRDVISGSTLRYVSFGISKL